MKLKEKTNVKYESGTQKHNGDHTDRNLFGNIDS